MSRGEKLPVGTLVDCYTKPEADTFALWKITKYVYPDDHGARVVLVAANDTFLRRSKIELGFSFVAAAAGLHRANPLVTLALSAL